MASGRRIKIEVAKISRGQSWQYYGITKARRSPLPFLRRFSFRFLGCASPDILRRANASSRVADRPEDFEFQTSSGHRTPLCENLIRGRQIGAAERPV